MSAVEQLDRLGNTLAAEIERIREALHAGAPVDTDRLAGIVDRCPNSSIPIRRGARSRGS